MNLPVQSEDKLQELNKNLEALKNKCIFVSHQHFGVYGGVFSYRNGALFFQKSVIERLGGRDITSSVSYIMKAVIGNDLVTRISMTGRSNSSAGDLLKFGDTNVASTIIGIGVFFNLACENYCID